MLFASRIFRLFMKGKFDAYVLWPLEKSVQHWLVERSIARNFTVIMNFIIQNFPQKIYKLSKTNWAKLIYTRGEKKKKYFAPKYQLMLDLYCHGIRKKIFPKIDNLFSCKDLRYLLEIEISHKGFWRYISTILVLLLHMIMYHSAPWSETLAE